MNHWTDRLQWRIRRGRADDSRKRTSAPRKFGQKLTNIARRLTIFFTRPYMRQFAHRPLPDVSSISSVLIVPNDPIGDLLLAEPLWRKLKSENPSLRIGLAVSSRNTQLANILEGIDERYNFYSGSLFARSREILRAGRARYDVVLVPVGFYKPARFAFISRFVAGRRGFTATMHHSRPRRYADFYSYCTERAWQPYPQPMVEQYQALVERALNVRFADDERRPRFQLPLNERQRAEAIVRSIREETKSKHVLLVHLEAKVGPREWGMENVMKLHGQLPHIAIILTASPYYWEKHPISIAADGPLRRIDTTSIVEAAALVACVDLLLSPDTSLVHFAAALDTPIVAFYPHEDEWLPYRSTATVLYPKRGEPISSIGVAEVRDAITALLRD